jgi:hypothetical protein
MAIVNLTDEALGKGRNVHMRACDDDEVRLICDKVHLIKLHTKWNNMLV